MKRCSIPKCFFLFAVLVCMEFSPLGAEDVPELLRPFAGPPASFKVENTKYPSPLELENGTKVQDKEEWTERRKEIRDNWMQLMGPWPPLLSEGSLELGEVRVKDGYLEQRIHLDTAPNQKAAGWLLLPEGDGPFPSVLVVFYDPETSIGLKADKPGRDFGRLLVREGIATLNIGTPGGNAWKPDIGTASCQPLSFHAYVAANAWHAMAKHPKLDPERIGVTGHSYGGKWAMFAAALWDRFAAVAVSDPGIMFDETRPNVNYWEPWYLGLDPNMRRPKAGVPTKDNPRTGAYKTMIERGMDLHEIHALIAPRPFLVSGGSEDKVERWHGLHHLVQVNQILGKQDRVFMTLRDGHGPTPESNDQLAAFFQHFLKP